MAERDLRTHVQELENRLADYHDRLTEAIKQRDELALDAAWGVTQSLVLILAKVTPLIATGLLGFATFRLTRSILLGWVAAAVAFLITDWIEEKRAWKNLSKDRQADRESLEPLPEYESEAEKLW